MPSAPNLSIINAAAKQLRVIVLAAEEGAFLGSEDALLAKLGVSRSTVRQVARLLEREGLLRVKRGINGGYYGIRPKQKTLEIAVGAYLETRDVDFEDVTLIATVLWVEVLRRASALKNDAARDIALQLSRRVNALKPDASFLDVSALEQESRAAIFALVDSYYIEMLFRLTTAFAQGKIVPVNEEGTASDRDFVRAWREAKLMELAAIADGDVEMGIMAARHVRNIWHRYLWTGQHGS